MNTKGIKLQNFTNNGICSCCGQCCSDILHLSKEEINRIDEYLKEHKIKPSPLKEDTFDLRCPFRNELLRLCMIYEVRPEICKIFKCDKTPEESYKNREFTNFNKKPRSMRALFFNDNTNIENAKKYLIMKVWGRDD